MKIIVWLLLCLIWGTTWLVIKVGLRDLPPISFASLRFVCAVLICSSLSRCKNLFAENKREWRLLAATDFCIQLQLQHRSLERAAYLVGAAAVLQATIPASGW
jgi:drug/metabolite transporter (DMT)-like permease